MRIINKLPELSYPPKNVQRLAIADVYRKSLDYKDLIPESWTKI